MAGKCDSSNGMGCGSLLCREESYFIIITTTTTAIEFSLGGSSPHTSTDKTYNIHKQNNTKHSKYKYTYYFVKQPTKAQPQLTCKPPCCHMPRHHRATPRELAE